MADLVVDPSQVHSIEVDPSAVSPMPPAQDAGFWPTIGADLKALPSATLQFLSGHPIEQTLQGIRDLTTARKEHQQRAADAYNKGDYKEAFHQLMFSIPIIGPPAGAAADEMQAGQTGQGAAHAVEALLPWIAPELNLEGFGRIGNAAARAPAAVAKKVVGAVGPAVDVATNPVVRDIAGLVSPPVAHGLSLVNRVKRIAGALAGEEAAAAPEVVGQYAGSKYEVTPQRFGTPTPAPPPPGFGVAAGSTTGSLPAPAPFVGPVYTPPVGGALPAAPGPVSPTLADMMRQRGFGIGSGNSLEPPAVAASAPGPAYQPPVGGALPGGLPAAAATMTPAEAEALFQEQKARITGNPPDTPPAAPPVAPAGAQIAADLEAAMRPDRLTDYLVANKIPPAMVKQFGPKEWQMIADQARTMPPTAEDIAAVRAKIGEYEGAASMPVEAANASPAEAVAGFEKRKATRTRKVVPIAPVEAAPQAAAVDNPAQQLAEMMPEHAAAPPAAGPQAPTASEVRVETLAKALAAGDIPTSDLAQLPHVTDAELLLEDLARAHGQARPAPGELPQIVERVRELRGEKRSILRP